MIKIIKSSQSPAILKTNGITKCDAHCRDYLLYKTEYDSGKRKFAFDAGICGHAAVKQMLIAAQHGKCCFCERYVGGDGDVEHFRPKAGCRQTPKGKLLRPGYYWLAYDWANLFLSCSACNQRHKRNFFPLVDPAQRACSHTDDIAKETPVFLNPATQDPEQFIGFRKEIPYAINDNPFGKATIKALGLEREASNEPRRKRLAILLSFHEIIQLADRFAATQEGQEIIQKAKAQLDDAVTDSAEFAAMARAAARNDFSLSFP